MTNETQAPALLSMLSSLLSLHPLSVIHHLIPSAPYGSDVTASVVKHLLSLGTVAAAYRAPNTTAR
jgi:hypothetical protein